MKGSMDERAFDRFRLDEIKIEVQIEDDIIKKTALHIIVRIKNVMIPLKLKACRLLLFLLLKNTSSPQMVVIDIWWKVKAVFSEAKLLIVLIQSIKSTKQLLARRLKFHRFECSTNLIAIDFGLLL